MLALLAAWQVLDGDVVLHGEMPGEKADAVAALALRGAQGAALQRQRVLVGIPSVVLGAVNRDVARRHPPVVAAADRSGRDQIQFHTCLGQELVRRHDAGRHREKRDSQREMREPS
jgi:hypothetical protein